MCVRVRYKLMCAASLGICMLHTLLGQYSKSISASPKQKHARKLLHKTLNQGISENLLNSVHALHATHTDPGPVDCVDRFCMSIIG